MQGKDRWQSAITTVKGLKDSASAKTGQKKIAPG